MSYLSTRKTRPVVRIMFSHAQCRISPLQCTLCNLVILFYTVGMLKRVQLISNEIPPSKLLVNSVISMWKLV